VDCQYVHAIVSFDSMQMREALDLTVEGSTAHTYMLYHLTSHLALLDNGVLLGPEATERPEKIVAVGSGYRSCIHGHCVVLDGFEYDGGLLIDLTVNGVSPGPRLIAGNGEPVRTNRIHAELLVAYQPVNSPDGLVVNVHLTTVGVDAWPSGDTSVYRTPEGTQRLVSDALWPVDIGADSNGYLSLFFEHVQPGGELTLNGCTQRCATNFTVTLPVGQTG
jgi:hypothetical protein